jgi:hypothetical protein
MKTASAMKVVRAIMPTGIFSRRSRPRAAARASVDEDDKVTNLLDSMVTELGLSN